MGLGEAGDEVGPGHRDRGRGVRVDINVIILGLLFDFDGRLL